MKEISATDVTGYKNIGIGWSDIAAIMFFCGTYGKVYRYSYTPKVGHTWMETYVSGFKPENFDVAEIVVDLDEQDVTYTAAKAEGKESEFYRTARDVLIFGEGGEYNAVLVTVPSEIPQNAKKLFKIEKCEFIHFFNDDDFEIAVYPFGEDVEIYQMTVEDRYVILYMPGVGNIDNLLISTGNVYDFLSEEEKKPKPREEALGLLRKRNLIE